MAKLKTLKCEEEGCKEPATHSVTLNIPAVGVPIDCHQPLRLYVDVKLCKTHASNFGQFFSWDENEELHDKIVDFVYENKFGERDFRRTFSSAISLSDNNYREIQNYLEEV